jgi:hypothetical protein
MPELLVRFRGSFRKPNCNVWLSRTVPVTLISPRRFWSTVGSTTPVCCSVVELFTVAHRPEVKNHSRSRTIGPPKVPS